MLGIKESLPINQYGQGLRSIEDLLEIFSKKSIAEKKSYLFELSDLIMQSKPLEADIETAIRESKLKPTFTPCVLLRKGVEPHHIHKVVSLPDYELGKVFILLLNLFKVAYTRRFQIEKNAQSKWWYWDLSDKSKMSEMEKLIREEEN